MGFLSSCTCARHEHLKTYACFPNRFMFINHWNGIGRRNKRSRLAASILKNNGATTKMTCPSSICPRMRLKSLWCHFQLWRSSVRLKGKGSRKMAQLLMDVRKKEIWVVIGTGSDCLSWSLLCSLPVKTQDNLQPKAFNEWPEVYKAKPV